VCQGPVSDWEPEIPVAERQSNPTALLRPQLALDIGENLLS
jgi:hypothetical protein